MREQLITLLIADNQLCTINLRYVQTMESAGDGTRITFSDGRVIRASHKLTEITELINQAQTFMPSALPTYLLARHKDEQAENESQD
ncbi:hypothetical protein [Spirosoma fluminis]